MTRKTLDGGGDPSSCSVARSGAERRSALSKRSGVESEVELRGGGGIYWRRE